MIPEIGNYCLMLALCLAIAQTALPIAGIKLGMHSWLATAKFACRAQFLFLLLSFICLAYAFITHDFSVRYVAENSNTALPVAYRFAAIWGAHEGSLLLWVLILAVWSAALSVFSRDVPDEFLSRVLSVLGFVSIGFLLFLILTSNPFDR